MVAVLIPLIVSFFLVGEIGDLVHQIAFNHHFCELHGQVEHGSNLSTWRQAEDRTTFVAAAEDTKHDTHNSCSFALSGLKQRPHSVFNIGAMFESIMGGKIAPQEHYRTETIVSFAPKASPPNFL
jgi:hypothetical protein